MLKTMAYLFTKLESPVPAGSRVAFFTGLKKVTKESAFLGAALGMSVA